MNRVGRRLTAVAALAVGSVLVAAAGITPSLAGWTDAELVHGAASSLRCGTSGTFDTQGWAQMVAGSVNGIALDGHLAGSAGITVSNLAPATSSSATGATPVTSLGGDAWTSAVNVSALDAVDLGLGATLPLDSGMGAEAQYARATSSGFAAGASGAVTTASGGLVSLDQPVSSAPGVGSVDLGTAMSSVVGDELPGQTDQLAAPAMTIGAVGSTTQEDGCAAAWQGIENTAAAVVRDYVISRLDLNFSSSLVASTTSAISDSLGTLSATLAAIEPSGTLVNSAPLNSAIGSLVAVPLLPLVSSTIHGAPTVTAGVSFDLAPAAALLHGTIGSGGVSLDLTTGVVSVDLATLLGYPDLNGLPANTALLTPENTSRIPAAISAAVTNLVTGALQDAITAAIDSASVNVSIATNVNVAGINAVSAVIGLSGTLGSFVDPAGNGAPHVTATLTPLGGAATALGLLGINLSSLLTPLTTAITTNGVTGLVGALGTALVDPVLSTATSDADSARALLSGTALPPVYSAFGSVAQAFGDAVQLTVNARPDAPGGVGTPDGSSTAGRFFETALRLHVVDPVQVSTLDLSFGSSSVGPIALR